MTVGITNLIFSWEGKTGGVAGGGGELNVRDVVSEMFLLSDWTSYSPSIIVCADYFPRDSLSLIL